MIEPAFRKEAKRVMFIFIAPILIFYFAIGNYFEWNWGKLANFSTFISGLVTSVGLLILIWQLVFQLAEVKEKLKKIEGTQPPK